MTPQPTDADREIPVTDADRQVVAAWQRDTENPHLTLKARIDMLRQAIAQVRASAYAQGRADEREAAGPRAAYAELGAWAFWEFWHDGEGGDVDGGDLQEQAVAFGLLRRRAASDVGFICGDGCSWGEGKPLDECQCWFPVFARAAQEGASDA